MLRPQSIGPVPDGTARIVHAAFAKGHLYLRLANELGALFTDESFAALFLPDARPTRHRTAAARPHHDPPVRRGTR